MHPGLEQLAGETVTCWQYSLTEGAAIRFPSEVSGGTRSIQDVWPEQLKECSPESVGTGGRVRIRQFSRGGREEDQGAQDMPRLTCIRDQKG